MAHRCVDWTTNPPTRKGPVLVLNCGKEQVYAKLPPKFEDLESIARKRFGLGSGDLEYFSSCINLCSNVPAEVTQEVWEDVAPYLGCVMVVEKDPSSLNAVCAEAANKTPMDAVCSVKGTSYAPRCTSQSRTAVRSDVPVVNATTPVDRENLYLLPRLSTHSTAKITDASTVEKAHALSPHGAALLTPSLNPWTAPSTHGRGQPDHITRDPEIAKCKLTSLLNRLTQKGRLYLVHSGQLDDSIPRRIVQWIDKVCESGDTLVLLFTAKSILERAIDDPDRAALYGGLCKKMATDIRAVGGKPFVQYLQESVKAAMESRHFAWGPAIALQVLPRRVGNTNDRQASVDEHCMFQQSRRRGLGLISFIGVLHGHNLLLSGAIPDCLKNLVCGVSKEAPTEGEVESLCALLRQHGQKLDNQRSKVVDAAIQQLDALTRNPALRPRLRHFVQEVIELRKRRWVVRPSLGSPRGGEHQGGQVSEVEALFTARTFEKATEALRSMKNTSESVSKVISFALGGKDSHALLAASLFANAAVRGRFSRKVLEEGFSVPASDLDDKIIDSSKALEHMATILKGAGFDKEEEREGLERIASKVLASDRLIELVLG